MTHQFEDSQTAKALKVLAAFRTLAAEYEAEDETLVAGTIRVHAMKLPLASLAKLYDILTIPAPVGARP